MLVLGAPPSRAHSAHSCDHNNKHASDFATVLRSAGHRNRRPRYIIYHDARRQFTKIKRVHAKKLKAADPAKNIDLQSFPAENIRNFSIIAHIGKFFKNNGIT